MRTSPTSFLVFTLVAAVVGPAAAQQADKGRSQPRQTVDRGIDDDAPAAAAAAPAEARAARAARPVPAVSTPGTRDLSRVAIVRRDDGTLVAKLDESFHDAMVVTKNADGTLSYTCLHGLPATADHLKEHLRAIPKKTSAPEVK